MNSNLVTGLAKQKPGISRRQLIRRFAENDSSNKHVSTLTILGLVGIAVLVTVGPSYPQKDYICQHSKKGVLLM